MINIASRVERYRFICTCRRRLRTPLLLLLHSHRADLGPDTGEGKTRDSNLRTLESKKGNLKRISLELESSVSFFGGPVPFASRHWLSADGAAAPKVDAAGWAPIDDAPGSAGGAAATGATAGGQAVLRVLLAGHADDA